MPFNLRQFQKKALKKKRKLIFFLKKFDKLTIPGLDKQVVEIDKTVWNDMNCMECANCCKTMTPTYKAADVKRISKHLGMSPQEFKDRWLKQERKTKDWVNKSVPCQFLVDNKCSIYEVRPKDCSGFPHHTKKNFDLYNDMYIQNLGSCPATFMLVERLQERIEKDYVWK
jgi:Fe-S-cluster containining protein